MDVGIWIAIGVCLACALGFLGTKKKNREGALATGLFYFVTLNIISSQPVIIESHKSQYCSDYSTDQRSYYYRSLVIILFHY